MMNQINYQSKYQISLNNISKTFLPGKPNQVHALNQITLEIREGERVALMGPSGSGKSTLLHILGLLDRPDSGTYTLYDMQTDRLKERECAEFRNISIGIILQDYGIIPELSALENVKLPRVIRGDRYSEAGKMAKKALKTVGLQEKASVRAGLLSGGQQQRVAIARALVADAKLILADEPTGALDTQTSNEIMDLLVRLNEEGSTVIVATHDPLVAERCNRIIRLTDGRVTEDYTRIIEEEAVETHTS